MLHIAIAPRLEAADQQGLTDAHVLALTLCGENRASSEIHDRHIRLVFSLASRHAAIEAAFAGILMTG